LEFCHPEVEWTTREDGVTHRGREAVRDAFERWLESFDAYSYEIQRIIDCGGDEVLVVGLEVGTGAMSGAEVRSVRYDLFTIRDVPPWLAARQARALVSVPPLAG
jgi:ketosteroid isomerase-like protein